jgi:hypothetical protein
VHTVIETAPCLRDLDRLGLWEAERAGIVTLIAQKPDVGDPIPGTGGCRKARIAGRGKGKSGGYRLITFYSGANIPVFLLALFGKGEKSDVSAAERNELAKLTKMLLGSFAAKGEHRRRG